MTQTLTLHSHGKEDSNVTKGPRALGGCRATKTTEVETLDGRRRSLCSGSAYFPSPGCTLPFPQGSLDLGICGIPGALVTHWPFPLLCPGTQAERPAHPCHQAVELLSGGVRDSPELTRRILLSCGTVSCSDRCFYSSTVWSRSHTHPVLTDDPFMRKHSF